MSYISTDFLEYLNSPENDAASNVYLAKLWTISYFFGKNSSLQAKTNSNLFCEISRLLFVDVLCISLFCQFTYHFYIYRSILVEDCVEALGFKLFEKYCTLKKRNRFAMLF